MLLRLFYTITFINGLFWSLKGQNSSLLYRILSEKNELCRQIIQAPTAYKVQIIYTQIDRDRHNKPHFTSHYFNVADSNYFYPASTVKLPACVLALEKINRLKIKGLNKYTPFLTDSAYSGQYRVLKDSTNRCGNYYPTIAHYIKQILLVSDNEAFNRLYEFLGQKDFNTALHQKGYTNTAIQHRLSLPLSIDENRHTNPIYFGIYNLEDSSKAIYKQGLVKNKDTIPYKKGLLLGRGELQNGQIIEGAKDFGSKNRWSLEDQHDFLKILLFPESVPRRKRFDLTKEDYRFLYHYLSLLPSESKCPIYDTSYYDAYVKFLMFGNQKEKWPPHLRIYNKVGDAYGFLIDNAYIVDFDKKIEFLLSAIIYCNSDGIFNDDIYDYNTIGFPFLKALGEAIYDYDCKRSRRYSPNLDYLNNLEKN